MPRIDGRLEHELREIKVTKNFISHPEGSVLIEMGGTKVICNATVEEGVPHFKKGMGEGWVSAEYSMLPRATNTRTQRDINKLKRDQRSVEIQRLIGRALRASIDFKSLGERTIIVDCDVIQADGGTRTTSITGGFIALHDACENLVKKNILKKSPIINFISAVSVGIVDGKVLVDLCYEEDCRADTDMNIVMTDKNKFIEIQGTGENDSFSIEELQKMISLAQKSNICLIEKQMELCKTTI